MLLWIYSRKSWKGKKNGLLETPDLIIKLD